MNEAIDKAIKALVQSSEITTNPADAMKLTQSALNLAHVKATLDQIKT